MFPGAGTSCSTGLGATSRREIHVWSPPEPISRSTDAATVRTVLPDRRCLPPPRRHLRPSDTGICSSTALRELSSAGRRGQSLAPAAATGGQASSLLRDEQVHHAAVAAYAFFLALALQVRVVHRPRDALGRSPVALGPRRQRREVAAHAGRPARLQPGVALAVP